MSTRVTRRGLACAGRKKFPNSKLTGVYHFTDTIVLPSAVAHVVGFTFYRLGNIPSYFYVVYESHTMNENKSYKINIRNNREMKYVLLLVMDVNGC